MKKLFLISLTFLFLLVGCTYERGIILFNTQPITKENALSDAKVFSVGQRVYYLFIAPRRMENKYIRVQIFKMTDKAPWGGNEVVRTKDFRLMKDERYYHSDYFTLHSAGRYVMQVFSIDDLQHPLSLNDFYIK
ncbi:MAG: hypothetical protein E7Z89_00670 [Cyanobacteria bacterium SIG28]|nr:hypothetical protein [Cyanobacteria bacterium SIG28]